MIKGRFVGKIEVALEVPDDIENKMLPYDEIKSNWEVLATIIEKMLKEELFYEDDGISKVSVSKIESEIKHENR